MVKESDKEHWAALGQMFRNISSLSLFRRNPGWVKLPFSRAVGGHI